MTQVIHCGICDKDIAFCNCTKFEQDTHFLLTEILEQLEQIGTFLYKANEFHEHLCKIQGGKHDKTQ
jgi:hypothetical protein